MRAAFLQPEERISSSSHVEVPRPANAVLEADHLLFLLLLLCTGCSYFGPSSTHTISPYSHCLLASFYNPKLLLPMTDSSAGQIPSLQLPILKFPALYIYLLVVRDNTQGLIHTKHSATRPHQWLYSLLGTLRAGLCLIRAHRRNMLVQ